MKQESLGMIERLNKNGCLVNVDFNPDGTGACSVLKHQGSDTWVTISLAAAPTVDQAVRLAYAKLEKTMDLT